MGLFYIRDVKALVTGGYHKVVAKLHLVTVGPVLQSMTAGTTLGANDRVYGILCMYMYIPVHKCCVTNCGQQPAGHGTSVNTKQSSRFISIF